MTTVVIGLGNRYRRDDGVGVVAADALNAMALNGVRVVTDVADPMSLLEAWSGAELAVLLDAAVGIHPAAGRVRRRLLDDLAASAGLSSHALDLVSTYQLGRALERVPDALVVLTVEVADTGHGSALTPPVAAAVSKLVEMAIGEIEQSHRRTSG